MATARDRRLPVVPDFAASMTEAELQRNILQAAKMTGWTAYHTRYSLGSEPGFPDVLLLRGERLLFAELKRATGKLTPAQEFWLWALRLVPGVEVFVWRPADWLDNSILRILLADDTRKDDRHADTTADHRAVRALTAEGAVDADAPGVRRLGRHRQRRAAVVAEVDRPGVGDADTGLRP